MTYQTPVNRHTQELENMERIFARITRDFEQELLFSEPHSYKPLLMTLDENTISGDTTDKRNC